MANDRRTEKLKKARIPNPMPEWRRLVEQVIAEEIAKAIASTKERPNEE